MADAPRFFSFEHDGRLGIGVEFAGARHDASRGIVRQYGARTLLELIEEGYFERACEQIPKGLVEVEEIPAHFTWLPPIIRPPKIIALVQNYLAHAAEFKNEAPQEPVWFAKLPSSLTGHEQPVVLPAWLESRVDHEVELAVVIGRRCKDAGAENWREFVAGYSIINDVSARHLQKTDRENKHPWTRCKNFDTFTPFGPYLVPAAAIADPQKLAILCRVGAETRQKSTTAEMIHPLPKLIAVLSRFMTLEPGDVIATGTPAGVGKLDSGDVCECEVEAMGVLRNPVIKR